MSRIAATLGPHGPRQEAAIFEGIQDKGPSRAGPRATDSTRSAMRRAKQRGPEGHDQLLVENQIAETEDRSGLLGTVRCPHHRVRQSDMLARRDRKWLAGSMRADFHYVRRSGDQRPRRDETGLEIDLHAL